MTEEQSDTTVFDGYTTVGGWNEAQGKEAQMNNALEYWKNLACANRKVAEDAQAQRDKAREDALEEAAKVCETHQDDRNRHDHTKDAYIATLQCAAAIRALKECGK